MISLIFDPWTFSSHINKNRGENIEPIKTIWTATPSYVNLLIQEQLLVANNNSIKKDIPTIWTDMQFMHPCIDRKHVFYLEAQNSNHLTISYKPDFGNKENRKFNNSTASRYHFSTQNSNHLIIPHRTQNSELKIKGHWTFHSSKTPFCSAKKKKWWNKAKGQSRTYRQGRVKIFKGRRSERWLEVLQHNSLPLNRSFHSQFLSFSFLLLPKYFWKFNDWIELDDWILRLYRCVLVLGFVRDKDN